VTETFTCASCGDTHEKGWSDEEAAAEAEELFPGMDADDPAEAAVVCDACYQHIMGRVRAEAPELIGEGWRGPVPIPDFPGFIASLLSEGCTLNPCRDHCQDKDAEHVHLRSPNGSDGIIWADGRVSEWDLTQPARLIYPAAGRAAYSRSSLPEDCYQTASGMAVHVRPGCRCR
jgi:hypothetical protein